MTKTRSGAAVASMHRGRAGKIRGLEVAVFVYESRRSQHWRLADVDGSAVTAASGSLGIEPDETTVPPARYRGDIELELGASRVKTPAAARKRSSRTALAV